MNAKGALRPVRLLQKVRPLLRWHSLASLLVSAPYYAARHLKGAQLLADVLKRNAAQKRNATGPVPAAWAHCGFSARPNGLWTAWLLQLS